MKSFIKSKNVKLPAYIRVLAGAVLISFSSVYVTLTSVTPTTSAFYRVFFGGLFLSIIVFIKKEKIWKDMRWFLLCNLAGFIFAVDLYFWHKSIHLIGPGLATVIGNFQVFFLTIAGMLFYREKISIIQAIAIPFAFLGLLPVVGFDWGILSTDYKIGLLLGVLTAISYAGYILIFKQVQQDEKALSAASNLVVVVFSSAFYLFLMVTVEKGSLAIPDGKNFVALLALGILSQGVGWVLITGGLPKIKAYLAGMLLLLQPSLSFLWDVLFFNRPTVIEGYLGLIVTLSAIYLGTLSGTKKS